VLVALLGFAVFAGGFLVLSIARSLAPSSWAAQLVWNALARPGTPLRGLDRRVSALTGPRSFPSPLNSNNVLLRSSKACGILDPFLFPYLGASGEDGLRGPRYPAQNDLSLLLRAGPNKRKRLGR
jgi:hypothetical protein